MTLADVLAKMKNTGQSLWPFISLALIVVLAYQSFSTNRLVVHTIRLQDSLGSIRKQLDTTRKELSTVDSLLKKKSDSLKKQTVLIYAKQGRIDSLKQEILSKPHDPKIDSLIAVYDTTINLYQQQLIATAELAVAAIANSAKKDTLITGYTQMIDGLNKELDRWTKKNTRRFDIGSGAIGAVIGAAIVTLAVVAK